MGHLEPSAAAAGLASLVLAPLSAAVVASNAQLRWVNAHLLSIVQSCSFYAPVEPTARARCAIVSTGGSASSSGGRLSSFGFSGTIAHGAFSLTSEVRGLGMRSTISCYRE